MVLDTKDDNLTNLGQQKQRRQQNTTDQFWLENLNWAFGSGDLNIIPFSVYVLWGSK